MSAFSTLKITRGRAYRLVLDHLAVGLSDDDLEAMCDRILEGRLYNCRIVDDGQENDDGQL